MTFYTFFDKKTDEQIAFGTMEECLEQLPKVNSADSFYSTVSLARHGKSKRYEVVVETLDRDELEDLAADAKAYRLRHKLSHQEFAKMLGVRTNTVQKWERGETVPSQKRTYQRLMQVVYG